MLNKVEISNNKHVIYFLIYDILCPFVKKSGLVKAEDDHRLRPSRLQSITNADDVWIFFP